MLVLSRRFSEKIFMSNGVTIQIVGISEDKVRLGIEAPDDVVISRGELAPFLGRASKEEVHAIG